MGTANDCNGNDLLFESISRSQCWCVPLNDWCLLLPRPMAVCDACCLVSHFYLFVVVFLETFVLIGSSTLFLYRRRHFPPKRRLLTNEEYYEQGARETTKALAELRRYCSSPESQPWRTMTRLQNPQR